MLTPLAFNRLIRFFDGVDRELANKLIRPRPHLEPGLTSLFADLIDPSTSGEYRLPYTQDQLRADIASGGGGFAADLKIEVNEYLPDFENRVSQSDIGLVLRYVDHARPARSWEKPLLLQAKRLAPDFQAQSHYTATSRFQLDTHQLARIKRLGKILGAGAVHFLLYCPRPDRLDAKSRSILQYARSTALDGNIFDYMEGLEMREQLGAEHSTLEAGVFVRDAATHPTTLVDLHDSLMKKSMPLSWFIAIEFADVHKGTGLRLGRAFLPRPRAGFFPPNASLDDDEEEGKDSGDPQLLIDVLRGKAKAIRRLLTKLDQRDNDPDEAPKLAGGVLPRHTMTVSVHAAPNASPEMLVID